MVSCGCQEVEEVNSMKYVGIILDQNIKWNAQIENVSNKIKYKS